MIYLMTNHASVWKLRDKGFEFGWLIGHEGWRKPARQGKLIPYALDNGMFFPPTAKPHGPERLCEFFGRCAKAHAYHAPLFAVVPDMPYDWEETQRRWVLWSKVCRQLAADWRWGIAVQDGASEDDLDRLGVAANGAAVCVGGSSEWKDKTIPKWGRYCERNGLWLHILRVNDADRMNASIDAGAKSVDGTGLFRGDVRPAKKSVRRDAPAGAVCDGMTEGDKA